MKRLAFLALVAAAWPATAHAEATIVSRELPVHGARTPAAAGGPLRFDLVGLHWRGPGTVRFRTRSLAGRWSAWQAAAPEAEDLPDPRTGESRPGGWHLGNPWWTGPADRLEVRASGKVTRLRAYYVRSPVEAVPYRTLSIAGSPKLITRSAWNADEKIRRGAPLYAPAVRYAVVHHTAGSNNYSLLQSGAIVRAIEIYHVRGNGWNDIGYNFLVDRYGQVFEGRYGGVDRPVIGAHAEGFNTGSVGVAVLGDYSSRAPSSAAQLAVARLLSWRLDLAHADPLSMLTVLSGGTARFPSGVPVFLRAISGHRDTGFTDCPGTAFYGLLGSLAGRTARLGLPKLYSPQFTGRLGGLVRFTGRLSSAFPWTVTVSDAEGDPVASSSGTGMQIDWTWDARAAAPGRYRWTMDAGPRVHPATGSLGGGQAPPPPPPPAELLTGLSVLPGTISPNGDGFSDSGTIAYTLGARASVTASILDANGATAATLFSAQSQSARALSFPLPADALADGRYTLNVLAVTGAGRNATLQAPFLADRTLSAVAVSPSPWSPASGPVAFTFQLAKAAQVRVEVRQGGSVLAVVFEGSLQPGAQTVTWAGTLAAGPAAPGRYQVFVVAQDDVAAVEQGVEFDLSG